MDPASGIPGIVAVDALRQVRERVEHDGPACMLQQVGRGGRVLDDCRCRRQIACQHRDTALRVEWVIQSPDDILRPRWRHALEIRTQSAPGHREAVGVKQRAQLAQYRDQAARAVQILHVVTARRFQIDQHGRLVAEAVDGREVDVDAKASRHSRHVDQAVSGSTYCE
jgi:hypothetical protein